MIHKHKVFILLLGISFPLKMAFAAESPSIELLEYLAEYAEDPNGILIDPIDGYEPTTESVSYRDYIREQARQK